MSTISDHIIYRRVAPLVLVGTLLLAVAASTGTYVNQRNDRDRDKAIDRVQSARIADNKEAAAESTRLLECFDAFATDLAGGLPPVRKANEVRNATITRTFGALEELLVTALAEPPSRKEGKRLARELVDALATYRRADEKLLQVQEANPYPDAPSRFCSTGDKQR